jgi:hypothetical protein
MFKKLHRTITLTSAKTNVATQHHMHRLTSLVARYTELSSSVLVLNQQRKNHGKKQQEVGSKSTRGDDVQKITSHNNTDIRQNKCRNPTPQAPTDLTSGALH